MAQSATASGGGGKKSKAVAVPATEKPMFVEVCHATTYKWSSWTIMAATTGPL